MSKLLEHFKRMQGQVALFISPAQYVPVHGDPCALDMNAAEEKGRFIDDMIYMLDGPEQREAQSEAQSMADQGYPTEDAYLSVCRALHWREGQLRAHGLEPVLIPQDAPHYPPDDHDFGVRTTVGSLRRQAARMIRSLMRDMRISDHLVMARDGETSSAKALCEQLEAPRVGDGTGDAAKAIAEHAFKAGYQKANDEIGSYAVPEQMELAWSEYDPPEDIKALS